MTDEEKVEMFDAQSLSLAHAAKRIAELEADNDRLRRKCNNLIFELENRILDREHEESGGR